MKIYTKTGDAGETGLLGGHRARKSAPRVASYGEVDELNATLGLAAAYVQNPDVRDVLVTIQSDLFAVGSLLADPDATFKSDKVTLDATAVERLEKEIDRFELTLPPLTRFILPGGSDGGALLHLTRAVARRAERALVALDEKETLPKTLVPYMNRLSDLLFVLARAENRFRGAEEKPW